MMDVEIKALERKDFSKAIDFAIKGMHFERYVDSELALRLYGRYFLYLELERATQVIAAYIGDKLVGILMADMKNEPKSFSSFWRKLYVKMVKAVMAAVVKGGPDIYDTANKTMFENFVKRATPDGEICFLAANPTICGKGKLLYLYTDDNCTYQFYEHKDFERSEEKEINMELNGRTVPLTCLLYSKQL